jgi:hypothetical protein
MKKYLLLPIAGLIGFVYISRAQEPGSVSTHGGPLNTISVVSGSTYADVSETLYIGPGIYIINGVWEIYSKNIVIDPAAEIGGTGNILFYSPSVAGSMAGPTLIDGNASANAILANVQLHNADGMQLTNIDFPADLLAAGFVNNTSASGIYIGAGLDLSVDGADIVLGTGVTGDLIFDQNGTITNYSPNRMVITNNSTLSHIIKENYNGSFTFPVGIANGDYTPAAVNNSVNNTIHVSVQDYAASASDEMLNSGGNGMQRTWNIYADNAAGNSTINLQHNTATNQNNFVDASHFVTQWSTTMPNTTGDLASSLSAWQSNTSGGGVAGNLSSTGTVAGSSMRSRDYTSFATSASDAIAYFSKSSDPLVPLPVTLISFTAKAETCSRVTVNWKISDAVNFSRFELEKSAEGTSFQTIGVILFDPATSEYSYQDNIQVAGNYFYRLKMIDIDGQYKYSPLVTVRSNCADKIIVLSPNPTRSTVTITGLQEGELVQLYDMNGKLLISKRAMNYQEELDLSRYPAGTYNLIIRNEKERRMTTKVIRTD